MKIRPVILCGGAGTRLWPNQKNMKVTRRFVRNLIKEAVGDDSCPRATQDSDLNAKNKRKASIQCHLVYPGECDFNFDRKT